MTQANIVGCILGTAVGDAIGLPYEGLPYRRAEKLIGKPNCHHFFFGRGMVSDDTEHTYMVAQALIESGSDLDTFRRHLGFLFRFWLLGIPAGIGMATLRAILRLWIGFSPHKSGVFSAGNGPAMRAAIIGATIDDPQLMRDLVKASTRITHTDPKAEYGAFAVALAAQLARQHKTVPADQFVDYLKSSLREDGNELSALIVNAANSASNGQSTESYADSLGLKKGVSGYVYHTVPVAIHAWFVYPHDFRSAITSVIKCGGDTDTTGAIVGGIIGTAVGKDGIPSEWINHILEWPRSVSWMERLAVQVNSSINTDGKKGTIFFPVWGILPRNLFFLLIVLYHGFRRLLPPY